VKLKKSNGIGVASLPFNLTLYLRSRLKIIGENQTPDIAMIMRVASNGAIWRKVSN